MATCLHALGNRGGRVFTDYNIEFHVGMGIFGRWAGYVPGQFGVLECYQVSMI